MKQKQTYTPLVFPIISKRDIKDSWKYNSLNGYATTFKIQKILKLRPLLFLLFVVTSFIYVITPISATVNDFLQTLAVTSLLALAAFEILLKERRNSPVINGLIVIPLVSNLLYGLAIKIFSKSGDYPESPIPELEYKIKTLIIAVIPVLLLLFIYTFKKKTKDLLGMFSVKLSVMCPDKTSKRFSRIFVFFFAAYLYSNALGDLPLLSYFARVFFYAFQWYVFWLGFWNTRLGKSLWLLSITMIVLHALIVFSTGGRYSAIIISAIFLLGYYTNQTRLKRAILRLNLIWAIPTMFLVVGILGIVRQEIGRGDFSIILEGDRAEIFWDAFVNSTQRYFSDDAFRERVSSETTSRVKGGGALEKVLQTTPDVIPYRGFENLSEELISIFRISALSSGFSIEDIKNDKEKLVALNLGTGAANLYGFRVTSTHSVEWPLAADAFSRGGVLVVILYYIIAIVWFKGIEHILRRVYKSAGELIIVFTPLTYIIFSGLGSKPLYMSIRATILNISLAIAMIYITKLSTSTKKR